MSTICENVDCPICMDIVEGNNNRVTTECGHCFHTSCLMKSVAHNGFGCPYCRTLMAEEVADEESEYDDDEDDEEEIFDDYILRGFRLFMNNINGEEHEQEDIEEEDEDQREEQTDEDQGEEDKPAPYLITQKLMEQGVNMEDLVKIILLEHNEYEREDEEYNRIADDMFGKLRIIISNYNQDQAHPPVPVLR
jgi:hypothetical protein